MKRRGAVLLLAVAAAVGLYSVPAGAVGSHDGHGRVLVVDKDAHRRSCYGKHRRVFRTIQTAVDAADPGDTTKVCPGRYTETVTVDEPDLTIKGANAGRDATRHGRGPESIVAGVAGTMGRGLVQLLEDDITWDGFTILGAPGAQNNPPGMYTDPAHSGYLVRDTIFQDNGNGIHLGASGEHPTLICRNRFVANNEFEGATGAYGIYSNEGARQVLITANKFERHNAAAIFLGDEGTEPRQRDVLIEHNKSVDDLSFATMFNSSRVRVTSNRIRARVDDPVFPGPASAIFIGARNDDIVVQKNKITSASGNGIDISNTGGNGTAGPPPRNVVVRRNKVAHTRLSGIDVSATGAGQYQVLATTPAATPGSASTSPLAPPAAPSPATPPSTTPSSTAGTSPPPSGTPGPATSAAPPTRGPSAPSPASTTTTARTTARRRSTRSTTRRRRRSRRSTAPTRATALSPGASDLLAASSRGLRLLSCRYDREGVCRHAR